MAEDPRGTGGISWLIRMVLDPASRRRTEESFRESGKKAGDAFSSVAKKAFDKLGISSGDTVAKQMLERMKARFDRDMGDTREALFRGLIDKKEAEKRGREAARDFNGGLLKGIEDLAKQGKLSDKDFVQLTKSLKDAGLEGGEQLNQGIVGKFKQLPALLKGIIGGVVLATIVRGLRNVADAIGRITTESARASQAARGFRNLAMGRGIDPTELLNELRDATLGVVPAVELMQRAQFALNADLPLTSKNIGELAFLSRRLAEAQGRDATEGFQRMVNGIVKGEQNLLEELGILVRMEDALKKYTRETGRSTEALSGQQKILLFYNEVVEEARRKVEGLGEEQIEAGQRVQQLTTWWGDARLAITAAILESPNIRTFFEQMGMGARNSADEVENLANRIGALVDTYGTGVLKGIIAGAGAGGAVGLLAGPVGSLAGAVMGGVAGGFAGGAIGREGTFGENLATRNRATAQRQRVQAVEAEVNAMSKVVDLEERRAKALEKQGALGLMSGPAIAEAELEVRKEIEAIDRRIAAIREGKGGGGGGTGEWEPVQMEAFGKAVIADAAAVGKMAVEDFVREVEERMKAMRLELEVQPIIDMDAASEMLIDQAVWAKEAAQLDRHQAIADAWTEIWRDAHKDVESAALATAYGIANAWKDTFSQIGARERAESRIREEYQERLLDATTDAQRARLREWYDTEMENAEQIMGVYETLARGMGAALLGGFAQYASAKIAENIALVFENLAKAYGNPPMAPTFLKAATGHGVAAAKWSFLAGLTGAAQGAVAGGGSAGLAGGIPSGARDPLGRLSERADAGPGEVIVYIDPFNPGNPVHVQKVGRAMDVNVRLTGRPAWAKL